MLTVAEQTVDNCCQELKERLSSFITEKEIIRGEEQAITNQSIMQILVGEFMPKWTRMRFRLLENEKDFVIEVYDAQGDQEMQPVKIRFKYEFDWGIESWEEAKMLCKEDRNSLFSKWRETGMTFQQIADHFNISTGEVYGWTVHRSLSERYNRRTLAVIKRVIAILEEVGLTSCFYEAMQHACECKMDRPVPKGTIRVVKEAKYMSSDTDMCLDIAILYIEDIINNIKEINKLRYTNRSMNGTLTFLSRATGFSIRGKREWHGNDYMQCINHEGLEKCIDFFNKILEKLNNQRKELAA